MKEIKPLDKEQEKEAGSKTVFLAGTIDMGNSVDWQHEFVESYKNEKITFFNPRREYVEGGFITDPEDFNYQVNWELSHLESADKILMFISGTSKSPISLMELGLFARTGKLIVVCEPNFYRYGNVKIVCERYKIPLCYSLQNDFIHNFIVEN